MVREKRDRKEKRSRRITDIFLLKQETVIEIACKVTVLVLGWRIRNVLLIMQFAFDTHKSIKELEKHSFTEAQAEAIVKVVTETRKEDVGKLATKGDLLAVKNEIALVRQELITAKKEVEALCLKLTMGFGGIVFALMVAFKLFDKFI